MNVVEIPERDVRVEFPECWDELSDEQFDFVMQQALKLLDGKIDVDDFKVLVLFHFLDIDYSPFDRAKEKRMNTKDLEERNANVWRLTELLDWFFVERDIKGKACTVFGFDSVRNFVPILNVSGEVFYGPDDALMNVGFGEYRAAVEFFRRYSEGKEDKDLDRLVAVLYRPERSDYESACLADDFDGERRVRFNSNHTERYASVLKDVPFYKRYAVFLWFANCNSFFREGEIEIGGNAVCFGDLYRKEAEGGSSKDVLGWTGLLFRLADEGTFGSVRETDMTNVYDVMLRLYQWKEEADELKKTQND